MAKQKEKLKLKYPIYIPSKGRADKLLTVKLLLDNNINQFTVIVEAKEANDYSLALQRLTGCTKSMSFKMLLVLPSSNYGTSSVARNAAIEDSKKKGFKKHWQLDDDITKIYLHKKGKVLDTNVAKVLRGVEIDDADSSSKITGINTSASFLSSCDKEFNHNGSLTSCYLITNDKYRFRGTMLVDMDYQLQVLRDGCDTLRCNNYAFVFKTPLKAKGGYYDIYSNDKKRKAAIELFFKNNPEVEPGLKRSSAGFLVAANISKVWRQFKKRDKAEQGEEVNESIHLKHWKGMPEFKQDDLKAYQKVVVNFTCAKDVLRFFKLIGQPYTAKTRSIWFPEVDETKYQDKRYSDSTPKKKKK